jgi:polyisoprenoid-binding protein YceI
MRVLRFALACAAVASMQTALPAVPNAAAADIAPLTVASARVSLDGTSNLHDFTASTTTVRVTALEVGGTVAGDVLEHVLQPGGLKAFDVSIPAATLLSPKDDLNKNMHKALKVQQHADIRFRLRAIEAADGAYRATGWLTVAGVEKEVTLNLQVQRKAATLTVTGSTDLLMTDYGIAPPKALLGMVKANPKVEIRIELVLGAPLT